MLGIEVTTRYHPRTSVERWQLQDRLTLRLRQMNYRSRPRFFEDRGGGLAFRIWLGWRPTPEAVAGLGGIDDANDESGSGARA
ncbi:MAG TPA: hypothetical protein VFM39_05930 [bacterium]|nr:hypothetical protein [bacterium]